MGLRSAATSALVSRTNLTKGRYHITRNVIKVISGVAFSIMENTIKRSFGRAYSKVFQVLSSLKWGKAKPESAER